MHIPTAETKAIHLLSFEEALQTAEKPGLPYDASKWLYVPSFYDEYRYILGTRGEHPLICVGINPSTAGPDHLDPTMKSAQRIAWANGYDSFLMFNVYAQRATRPDDMEKERNDWLHGENMKAFRYLLSLAGKHPAVWAAWGSIIEKRKYLLDCVQDMLDIGKAHDAIWFYAGSVSARGHPHHPLYLRSNTPLTPFDVEFYLRKGKIV